MRTAEIERKTNETEVKVKLNIEGSGKYSVKCGIGFLEHMLSLFAKQGLFDLEVEAKGDLNVDEHHLTEDIGIVLGSAFKKALGEKKGIRRYGFFLLPMDESLASAAVDLSGRYAFAYNVKFEREKIGNLPTELIEDFFGAFAQNCQMNLHLNLDYGRNEHHKAEALFKAFGKSMRMACEMDERLAGALASTKGVL